MKPITFLFLILTFGLGITNCQSVKNKEVDKKIASESKVIDDSFGIALQFDHVIKNQYLLGVAMNLDKGSYIISPFSQDSIYGNFSIAIEENNFLTADEVLVEVPKSVEEMDPIIERPVRFVRVNTIYHQKIKVLTKEDFEVTGLIEFVLEPSCVPYDVEFILAQRAGKMKVKKIKTVISKEYKLGAK